MKNILRELTLPAFWLFVFIVSPRNEGKTDQLQKADRKELIQENISSGATGSSNKNKEATFTKVASPTGNSN